MEASETEVVRDQLQREGIHIISGTARFLPKETEGEPHRVIVLRSAEKAEAKTRYVLVIPRCPSAIAILWGLVKGARLLKQMIAL